MSEMEEDSASHFVFPGSRICSADENRYQPGNGTFVLHGCIFSSLCGKLKLSPIEQAENGVKSDKGQDKGSKLIQVEVESKSNKREQIVIPGIGDVVTTKVLSVNPRFAKMSILCVQDSVLKEPFRAQLRREDVRATEKDKVEMYKSIRPGDIVLARVLSLGEASSGYLLTTAENELGVAIAKSEMSGSNMVPISWTEMQCPNTFSKEFRKIAKICPENLTDMI